MLPTILMLLGAPGGHAISGYCIMDQMVCLSKLVLVFAFCNIVSYLSYSCSRSNFDDAARAWHEHGDASDLYVIIIDEIDAICKHRGEFILL